MLTTSVHVNSIVQCALWQIVDRIVKVEGEDKLLTSTTAPRDSFQR